MPDYDLKAALKRIQAKRFNFVLIKGAKSNQVVIAPRPPSPKLLEPVMDECGDGKRIAKGVCMWEGDQFVFATKAEPASTWATMVTKIFKEEQCNNFLPVAFRKLAEGESEEVAADESEQPPPVAATPAGPPAAPATVSKKQLIDSLNKLSPLIKQAAGANPARKEEMLRLVADFQTTIKADQLQEAKAAMMQIATLLKSLGISQTAPATGDGSTTAPKTTKPLTPVWNAAKEQLDTQLSALQLAMRRYSSIDPEMNAIADEIAQALGNYRTGLVAALMDYDSAPPEARQERASRALKLVQDYRARVASDPAVQAADENPFDLNLNIQGTLGGAFDELSAALSA